MERAQEESENQAGNGSPGLHGAFLDLWIFRQLRNAAEDEGVILTSMPSRFAGTSGSAHGSGRSEKEEGPRSP
jgi:hypothetical protein